MVFLGPMSVALYIKMEDYAKYKQLLFDWLKEIQRDNIIFHFVFERGVSIHLDKQSSTIYPKAKMAKHKFCSLHECRSCPCRRLSIKS